MRLVFDPEKGSILFISISNIKEPSCENVHCPYLGTNCQNNCMILPNNHEVALNGYMKYYVDINNRKIIPRKRIILNTTTENLVFIKQTLFNERLSQRYNYTTANTEILFTIDILEQDTNQPLILEQGTEFYLETTKGSLNKTKLTCDGINTSFSFSWIPPSYWIDNIIYIKLPLGTHPKYYTLGTLIQISNET